MKISKAQLENLIKEAVKKQLDESVSVGEIENRIARLDRHRLENNLSVYEILEDVLEQIDNETWEAILKGINYKYGISNKNNSI